MTIYTDASALVKRYIAEDGSDEVRGAIDRADAVAMCRVGFVETARAVALAGERRDVKRVERNWAAIDVVEVDRALTERAAELAISYGLRALDALHLAAALSLPPRDLLFATWDRRLHRAARAEGLTVLPEDLD
ncbi:MAG TPA: type II toxin-antitoxin system VapC family toxin [Solirubrobacterales bacterium]|nr:type II toxin-antitoxin system VapC family toxin [Solirubrobacterales bacterium]